MEDSKPRPAAPASPADTTPKVTGISGIFFFLDDPKGTKEWYAGHLGLPINSWGGVPFESRDLDAPRPHRLHSMVSFRAGR